jgi:Ribbon-helix-helix protein, copG family
LYISASIDVHSLPMDRISRGPNGQGQRIMQRTTLMIPDELHHRLRQLAAEREVSMATVVREALEESVARARPIPRSLGVGDSGSVDTASRTAAERPEPRAWR